MRKKLLAVCGILWAFAFFQMIKNYEGAVEPDIVTAFGNEMFVETLSVVEGNCFYKSTYFEDDKKREILEETAKLLGIEEPYEIQMAQTSEGKKMVLTKLAKTVTTVIGINTVETEGADGIINQKQYLTIDMEFENSLESALLYKEKIEAVYKELGMSADVYLSHKGNINGELSNSEKNMMADKIIEGINGDITTQNRGKEMFVVYGYTDEVDEYVTYGSKKTNINIVIRFNELTQMTEVYMGVPIINADF